MINVAQILKNLAAFCSVKGVQPDELVTAIFEKEYKKIETYKVNSLVYFIMNYSEKFDEEESIICMRYIYDENKSLVKIEQKINSGRYSIQWDRNDALRKYILNQLSELPSPERDDVYRLILENLPCDAVCSLPPQLKLVS